MARKRQITCVADDELLDAIAEAAETDGCTKSEVVRKRLHRSFRLGKPQVTMGTPDVYGWSRAGVEARQAKRKAEEKAARKRKAKR